MAVDFSWEQTIEKYVAVYRRVGAKVEPEKTPLLITTEEEPVKPASKAARPVAVEDPAKKPVKSKKTAAKKTVPNEKPAAPKTIDKPKKVVAKPAEPQAKPVVNHEEMATKTPASKAKPKSPKAGNTAKKATKKK